MESGVPVVLPNVFSHLQIWQYIPHLLISGVCTPRLPELAKSPSDITPAHSSQGPSCLCHCGHGDVSHESGSGGGSFVTICWDSWKNYGCINLHPQYLCSAERTGIYIKKSIKGRNHSTARVEHDFPIGNLSKHQSMPPEQNLVQQLEIMLIPHLTPLEL